jgi:hypothetical protein
MSELHGYQAVLNTLFSRRATVTPPSEMNFLRLYPISDDIAWFAPNPDVTVSLQKLVVTQCIHLGEKENLNDLSIPRYRYFFNARQGFLHGVIL